MRGNEDWKEGENKGRAQDETYDKRTLEKGSERVRQKEKIREEEGDERRQNETRGEESRIGNVKKREDEMRLHEKVGEKRTRGDKMRDSDLSAPRGSSRPYAV